jgi:glutamine synthetase
MDPGPPINKNVYQMSEREKRRLKIGTLPADLREALDCLSKDDVVKRALGEHVYDQYYKAKTMEWQDYITAVHPWERDRYLSIF